MRTTRYFRSSRSRRHRVSIRQDWIQGVLDDPESIEVQTDGRMRLWGFVVAANRYVRVVTLEDGRTVHNAFFDRSYVRTKK